MESGAVEKVMIFAYKDKKMREEVDWDYTPFFLPINPESYSQNLRVESNNERPPGNQGTDSRYNNTAPEELKLDFFFDGTGTVESYFRNAGDDISVKKQLEIFLKLVYFMDGQKHRPNFLKIHWGTYLVFPCTLSSLDINYQLFQKNGDPLRAKISATFIKFVDDETQAATNNKKSPDLTHFRTVIGSNRLDNMTFNIYNDTKYLLQVARANRLASFRKIKAGQELYFPPIQKNTDDVRK